MTEDEPAPKSKKKTWLIVLLAIGIPVVCGVICCGGLAVLGWTKFRDLPAAMINAQLFLNSLSTRDLQPANPNAGAAEAQAAAKEEQNKRFAQVYEGTSSGFKTTVSLEQFRELLAKNPVLTTGFNTQFTSFRQSEEPGVKKVIVNATVSDGASSVACTITLIQENEQWKVDGFTVP
jgi:hypothetical protein